MASLLSFGLNILGDIFYPKYCFGCQRGGSYLCKFCMSQIPKLAKQVCIGCNQKSLNGFTHATCLGKSESYPNRLLSGFAYQNAVVSKMIITGKYYFVPEVFAVLGAITADWLFNLFPPPHLTDFYICAIPLHPFKHRWRGFNQSEIAARVIADGLQIPYIRMLTRTKNTKVQKDLDAEARKINMSGAFLCTYRAPEKVIIIDDVCTTGQTFLDATRALRQAGAKEIWCISIAKD